MLTERGALESEFKKVHGPRVVVLSTHGFFLERGPESQKLPVLLRWLKAGAT